MKRYVGAALLVLSFVSPTSSADKKLDDGLLDPEWFGSGVEFRTTDVVDYLWVKPGFTVKGKTIHVQTWTDPVLLDKKRDAKDSALASKLTDEMPGLIRGSLSSSLADVAKISRESGDLALTGRFVDSDAGSKTAKWLVGMGAGSASATWDMKIVDVASGGIVAAIHHRAISGTKMTEEEDKIAKWLAKFGPALADDLAVYAAGKPAKK